MEIILNPARSKWNELCLRNIPDNPATDKSVQEILDDVRNRGDKALKEYARRFDGIVDVQIKVSKEEIEASSSKVKPEVKEAISTAIKNIRLFHEAQFPKIVDVETMPGVRCIQKAVPIDSVGLYIPGGRAPLFSTVLMLAIPAKIAGCKRIALCTPRSFEFGISPEILFAASQCGVSEIYGVGGAQAIAALAYGTETINPVHKIFGPGNSFVTKAKQLVSGKVAIDMPAGPSEVLVMADETANPLFVAADLLSQSEHGPDSQSILVCKDEAFARETINEIEKLKPKLGRKDCISKSLSQSKAIVLTDTNDALDFINLYAPEHLILSISQPWEIAAKITSAGSVFIGNYSPESAGDYASGTNHTLPTSGWATSFSGVNTESFMHKITFQELTKTGILALGKTITSMARAEGLEAHALAVEVRNTNPTRK